MTKQLKVEHIAQPAVLVEDLDTAMDWLFEAFRIYPSERVDIKRSGVHNAVYAFANRTYLELIAPYDEESSAHRLLRRSGPGWHMVSVDIVDAPSAALQNDIEATGARIVQHNRTDHVTAWHLHPADTHGVLLNLANPTNHEEHGMWAGWAWREYVPTNTRILHSILGLSVVTDDLTATQSVYTRLGFDFGTHRHDGPDTVIEATCPQGSFLQIREPRSTDSPGAALLESRGRGLYHLCWSATDLDRAKDALTDIGAELYSSNGDRFWTRAETTGLHIPMEFRGL